MKIKFLIFIITITSSLNFVFAQERTKDTIDDQVVNVVKPYTPTISDAFKIKDTPQLNDSSVVKKKEVKYNIFSIPVASTFTPAKGKAAKVDKAKFVKLYDNYASLGVGTYTSVLGEVYLNHELNSGENVGGYFSHHSSAGGIEDIELDDNFSKTSLNVHYSQKLRDFSWKVDAGFDLQTYNWYGLPSDTFTQDQIDMIDPGHSFNSFYVGGKLKFDDAIIKDGSVRFRRFGDNQNSGENRFVAKTSFDLPIQGETINTEFSIDYIGGSFDRNYNVDEELRYGNVAFGLAPSYRMTQDDLTIDLGVKLVYLNDTEFSNNKFFIYPNIEASYRLVDEIVIAYGGLKGDLIQNSYYDFANTNPFVSPTLFVLPTNQQYKAFVGLKGKLSNNVSYNIKGNYYAEESKALYRINEISDTQEEDYQYSNSFGVVYDDVKTFSVAGELSIDVNRNFTLGIKGEYFNYNVDEQAEAWNLPDVTGSVFLDYQISEKWYAGGSLYYVGERKDRSNYTGTLLNLEPTNYTLDSYLDANAHLGYKINEQLSVFGKVNNIANQDYNRWANFPVQSIQFLAGATYQFDF
ncbi:TonB-dependent receptor [Winogradskyella echinorum]|uniref:TonB-dependent receptor n=1 Tax=Winogradskyella echinorum TaxID=538189 RepID=A0ABR6XWE2_9FLAO|nr:TonB-dependent receptor [Winogradskyella echinorum]MBC3844813.1 TonB-dependent receptor [Winogradskyella echinorum]MBC5749161.1 TonB-dependent receptor [Winogradskyella echinorum]